MMKESPKNYQKITRRSQTSLFISERAIAGFSVFEASSKLGTSLEGSVKATGNTP